MPRPIVATIDLDALLHNLSIIKQLTSAKIMAVAKASAYGHGLLRCLPALELADGIAVLDISEATSLRQAGYKKTILLLEGFFSSDDLQICLNYNISCVIHQPWQLALLKQISSTQKIDIWLKINTGMNRLGINPSDLPSSLKQLQHSCVTSITLMSHFANADLSDGIETPYALFEKLSKNTQLATSCANSAAIIRHPACHGDWVRPGLMLYGASPCSDISTQELGLYPAMTLSSQIIAIQHLNSGDSTGYGMDFYCKDPMRIGIVACGYADGYPRHAPTGTPVWVHGTLTHLVGRVSMDMLAVNLNQIPDASINSPVELWGAHISIDDVAQRAGTISYELMCAITARVSINLKIKESL